VNRKHTTTHGRHGSPLSQARQSDDKPQRVQLTHPVQELGADLTIGVSGNVVTLTSSIILPSGATHREKETLRADGTETAGTLTPGVVHVANWVGSHVLALIARKGNQNIALITYEVSTDGQTLTARTSGLVEQVVRFKRR
jgi:hypothetical protein